MNRYTPREPQAAPGAAAHTARGTAPLYGLVLAGGASSRMGRDKAFLRYHGTSQVRYLFRLLSACCPRVFVSIGPDRSVTGTEDRRTESLPAGYLGLPVIRDRRTGIGPAAGLLAAAEAFPEAAWLAAAVDMPGIGPKPIRLLVSRRDPARPATVPFDAGTGVFEPLFAIYEPEAMSAFSDAVANGRYGLQRALHAVEVKRIPRAELGPLGNVNTPEEYRSYKESGR